MTTDRPPAADPDDARTLDEQLRAGDLRADAAEERERLADEREQLADERERLADEREHIADEQERWLEQRSSEGHRRDLSNGGIDAATSLRDAEDQVRRAEAAVRRADDERQRALAALARARATAERHATTEDRLAAERSRPSAGPARADELGWWSSRRDFVASARADLAADRDRLADTRDALADQRERTADARDQTLRTWESDLDRRDQVVRRGMVAAAHDRVVEARARLADGRARADRQRRAASTARSYATHDRGATAHEPYGTALVSSFAALSRTLLATEELHEILHRVTRFAVDAVDGCHAASATILRNGGIALNVATDPSAAELDAVQFDHGLGPAVEALTAERPVAVTGLDTRRAWPDVAELARECGLVSVVCYGLSVKRAAHWEHLGVLTLASASPEGLDDATQEVGGTLASYAAVATAFARDRDEIRRREAALHRALNTRDVIGQAKGILMERHRMSAGQAFDVLRSTSQRLNRKVGEVAERLAESGELPE